MWMRAREENVIVACSCGHPREMNGGPSHSAGHHHTRWGPEASLAKQKQRYQGFGRGQGGDGALGVEFQPQERAEEQSCRSHEVLEELWDLQAALAWSGEERAGRGAVV